MFVLDYIYFEMKSRISSKVLSKSLSTVIILAILGAITALIYIIAIPTPREKFTEFYILGAEGKATDYPTQLNVGEEARLILGISNEEQDVVSYRVEIKINGAVNGEVGPIILKHDEKFEQAVSFTPTIPGDKQKVEFLLYKEGQSGVYESLHLLLRRVVSSSRLYHTS